MDFVRRTRMAAVAAFVGALLLVVQTPLHAQTTSASIFGQVKDAQGGALPGATATLTSKTQGNTLNAQTDAEGRFVFAIVRPDAYTLKVTLQGFKTLERTNVVVSANDKSSVGVMVLQVGQVTEEISVLGRVSELQSTSGERSFTLESEALKNIANNGRMLFNFANLVPGAVQNGTSGTENGQVSSFTVNGQRPNSNNMTIDGVSNIDTGDNGGNMATTNIDAVAEFKLLTNAYQAEYGRAVGGQLQVVTKSGTQAFHGSGYWYGRRSDWNANTWTNKRAAAPPPVGNGAEIPIAKSSRNDYGYTFGGPIFIPGVFNTDKKKLFFFWSQEYQRRSDPAAERQARVPTALERAGDFSKSVDSSGNPFPYIRDWTKNLPCNASNTSGCFADGGVLGKIPQNRLYAPGVAALNIYPTPNFQAGSGINFTSQVPDEAPRREDLLRLDFQASDKWRFTGRYMNTKEEITQAYGTTWAGNGSDRLPTPTLFLHPGSNYLLSATGILNSTTSLEMSFGRAANSLDYDMQLTNGYRGAAGLTQMPLLYPEAVQADYIPDIRFAGGRTGNAGQYQTDRGPFTNENITQDALANLTKIWGSHSAKFGVYYQHSYKPQSIFASFNSQINFTDDSNNPYDTGYSYANAATGVFNTYTQANKFALPEWNYKNFEWYGQDNWKATSRLTLDYGVRFYYLTPQWDTTLQASNFLPDKFDQANKATLYVPACVGASPCSGAARVGLDPKTGQTVEGRFIGRLVNGTTDAQRFNGAFQAGQGINDQLQDGSAFKISPRFGFVYDVSGSGTTIVRGGAGVFYDRPQGNMVFDMIANAPGVLNSSLQWGRLQDVTSAGGGGDPNPTLGMTPTVYDFKPPKVYSWNVGVQHKVWHAITLDLAYVGSSSKDMLRQNNINAVPFGAAFLTQNQDPTKRGECRPRGDRAPQRPHAPLPGLRHHPHVGLHRLRQLPLAPGRYQPPVRQRVHVLGVLRVEQGAHHQQRRLRRFVTAERQRRRDQAGRLLLRELRPAAELRPQLRLPDPEGRERRPRRHRQRLAALGHLPLDERSAVHDRLLDPRHRQHEPHRDPRLRRPRGGDVRPGPWLEQRSLQADRHLVLRPAEDRQRRHGVGPVLPVVAADRQPRHVRVQGLPGRQAGEDGSAPRHVQRAQPHPVHGRQQHRELREPHRPDDHQPAVRRERQPRPEQRVREHQRGRSPADSPARDALDVLDRNDV